MEGRNTASATTAVDRLMTFSEFGGELTVFAVETGNPHHRLNRPKFRNLPLCRCLVLRNDHHRTETAIATLFRPDQIFQTLPIAERIRPGDFTVHAGIADITERLALEAGTPQRDYDSGTVL